MTAQPRERRHPAGIGTNAGKLAFNAAAAQLLLAQLRVNLTITTVEDPLLPNLHAPKIFLSFFGSHEVVPVELELQPHLKL
jgi:hypothetical protein